MRILSKLAWLSLVLFPALTWGQAALAFECDESYVSQSGNTFTVMPTGSDDTANIQCAFDEAVAAGPGATVELIEGTYHTAQIVVRDFVGSFRGAGMNKTVVQNLLKYEVNVTEDDFFNREPSEVLKWPTIFAFVDHIDDPNDPDNDNVLNVSVSDMTIRAMGDPNDSNPDNRPTDGWSIFGLPTLYELAHAIVVLGTETHVVAKRMLVEGQEANGTLYGYNLINGIYPQGDFGGTPGIPMKGSFIVSHSTFRNLASGVPFGSVTNYRARFRHNTFENVFTGVDVADISHTSLVVADNEVVDALIGAYFYNFAPDGVFADGIASSRLLVRDNLFSGGDAVVFDVPFLEDVYCRLLDNDISAVEGPGVYPGRIYLGPDTRDCGVINSGRRNQIVDEGTDNIVIPGKALGHWLRKWPYHD